MIWITAWCMALCACMQGARSVRLILSVYMQQCECTPVAPIIRVAGDRGTAGVGGGAVSCNQDVLPVHGHMANARSWHETGSPRAPPCGQGLAMDRYLLLLELL